MSDARQEHYEAVWAAKEGASDMASLLARLTENARTNLQIVQSATGGDQCSSSHGRDAFEVSAALVTALEPLMGALAQIEEDLNVYMSII